MNEPTLIDLAVYRGDDTNFTLEIVEDNEQETPIDFSNYRLDLHIKPDNGAVLKLSTTTGEIVINGNQITLNFSHNLTKDLKWDSAKYDLQSIDTYNKVKTICMGEFTLIADITKVNEI